MRNANVYLVDDNSAVRRSLSAMLQDSGFRIESFDSGIRFLSRYDPIGCGCILMDIVLPDISGLDVLDRLSAFPRAHPMIMMTGQADVPMATRALESGAFAFVEKPIRRDELIERIDRAVECDRSARNQRDRRQQLQQRFLPLTRRERQVLDLVVAGKLTKQIAVQLGISQRTVETHRGNIMTKLRTETLAELVAITIENRDAHRDSQPEPYTQSMLQRPWRQTDWQSSRSK